MISKFDIQRCRSSWNSFVDTVENYRDRCLVHLTKNVVLFFVRIYIYLFFCFFNYLVGYSKKRDEFLALYKLLKIIG